MRPFLISASRAGDRLAGLRPRDFAISAVGMQNHVSNHYRPSEADVSETMRRFVALGLDVAVTEMDVRTDNGGTRAQELALQRQVFTASARACRLQFRCRSFTTWGVSDKYSWLGAAKSPLLFDVNMQPKPAFAPVKDWIRRP